MLRRLALTLALTGIAAPLLAADFSDPTWPCVQRKVGALSAGLMWASPADAPAITDDRDLKAEIERLADVLSLRRVPLDDLRPTVEAFANQNRGDAAVLNAVFTSVFSTLNTRRSQIIAGIEDFSLSQIALSEKIDAARVEMDTLMAADAPDFDKVDALEEQLDWDQVIFSDRQKSIQYLCETPVIIERRLFSIAQMLQQMVQDG
ncbi:MAG: hypothetical protein AAF999_12230 [Pseudomonadota bacterium]